jgi:Bacterial Ig domain
VQLSVIRACARLSVVGSLLAVMSACGGGGGASPNPSLGTLAFTTNENVALNATLTATDPGGSAVTFATTSNPTSGTLAGLPGTGAFTYKPNANFTGSDSFGITATDAAGHATSGTVKITVTVDQAPTASNTAIQSNDGKNVNILQAANDPEKDPLTVTVSSGSQPNVGTVTVNADNTVTVSGSKGLVTFGYTVTDPSGKTASANAAVFVGVQPFRAAFVADSSTNGSYEVFLTDFVSAPTQISNATQGTLRLKGFAIADNGSTVVYRTQDTNTASTTSLSFVRTATPATQIPVPIPNGLTPVLDGNGKDQFVVSPDGTWIALIAGAGGSNSLYLVNTATSAATAVVPSLGSSAALFASQPTFTSDSKSVYFLASSQANGANKSLFVVATSNLSTPVMVSDLSRLFSSDDITAYSVAPNQSTITFQGSRNGSTGVFYVDPSHLTQIQQVNADIVAAAITSSTVGLPPGLGGSNTGTKVAYDVGIPVTAPESVGIYVAAVPPAAPPAPQFVASIEQVIGFNPDDSKLLYTDGSQVSEIAAAAGGSGQQIGNGNEGWYDSGGNIVLVAETLSSGGATLSSNTRPFGSPSALTATGTAAFDLDVSGVAQGVAIYGQVANNGSAPPNVSLQLFDIASSNTHPITLKSTAASPVDLTTYASKIVSK